MCGDGKTLEEKFQILKELGYDGVELDSPGGQNKDEAKRASEKVGLPTHGVVDSIHWGTTLSDPSAEVRAKVCALAEQFACAAEEAMRAAAWLAQPEMSNETVWSYLVAAANRHTPTTRQLHAVSVVALAAASCTADVSLAYFSKRMQ